MFAFERLLSGNLVSSGDDVAGVSCSEVRQRGIWTPSYSEGTEIGARISDGSIDPGASGISRV